jgi:uncharacterized protein (TIGR00369 family)
MNMLNSPYARSLRVVVSAISEGRVSLRVPFGHHLLGRPGFLHGGAIAGVLTLACDHAVTVSVFPSNPGCHRFTYTVQFLHGAREQDLYAAATIIHSGANSATINAVAWQDRKDMPIAIATCKYLRSSTGARESGE